ncbi:LUD domain-containing protein [Halapricum desulfuricans]|uniref:L-lactate utilization protein LutC, contains LUDdomain n=1 Tax=Halapricum desulfuricans TaxID=2841257 RepID=A0A897NA79_9EURY|nr:LUD domain-containing protein [Halapricum desulfuricans]QSG09364.1 L-lactate utilization protein LutC, contains LUDdomain [Halapricum desulfuricans]
MATIAGNATVDRFAAALDDLDVGWTLTTVDELSGELERFSEPTVGAPFPFEDLSLPDSIPRASESEDVKDANTGVTAGVLAIAEYGSVVIGSEPPETEPVSLYADTHVAVVRAEDVVASMGEAFAELGPRLREAGGNAIIVTGPSATADMGALVRGVHGPGDVHVVIVE